MSGMKFITVMVLLALAIMLAAPFAMAQVGSQRTVLENLANIGEFSTMLGAIRAAGLDNVLKGPGEFTVFAPVDSAFAKLPKATLKTLSTPKGAKTLQTVLTYHVIQGQLSPDQIDGTHKTVQGGSVKVTGSGDNIKVNGSTSVICGGVHTANATVYLIDNVLMPKM